MYMYAYSFCYRALLYVTHGVGEHMGRYEKLGRFLAENGILAYGHDHGEYNYFINVPPNPHCNTAAAMYIYCTLT